MNLPVIEKRLKDDLYFNNIHILSYNVAYPNIALAAPGAQKINRYFDFMEQNYVQGIKSTLFAQGIHQYMACQELGKRFIPYFANKESIVTLSEGLLSVYQNALEYSGDSECLQEQTSLTFDATSGKPLILDDLFIENSDYIKIIITYLIYAIAKELDKGVDYYYENWLQLMASAFDVENFYVLDRGIAFYYQQDSIAEPSAGICTYIVPFENIEEYLRTER